MNLEDLRQFQVYMAGERRYSAESLNQFVSAAKFLYGVTLEASFDAGALLRARAPSERPSFSARKKSSGSSTTSPASATGLRVSEVVAIKVGHIDSPRKLLRVEQGKGKRDRYTLLSPRLLEVLRTWPAQTIETGIHILRGTRLPPGLSIKCVNLNCQIGLRVWRPACRRGRPPHKPMDSSPAFFWPPHNLGRLVNVVTIWSLSVMKISDLRCAAVVCLAIGIATAQQPARTNLVGAVQAIDGANGQITLGTDDGKTVKIVPHAGAKFLRLPPGEKSLANATPITAGDIGPGDRLLARGELSADKSELAATTLVIMTKADIAKKQQADQAEWQKRGVGGLVTAVDAKAGEVTINTRTVEGMKPLIIVAGETTGVRRYAPDSVKFADAKPAMVAEIKVGDQVRALGTKSEDGMHYAAEELVSGSFRNVAATVTSIDAAASTMKVMDLSTKKPLLVHVNADSTMRKLPEAVAKMIAMRTSGGGGGAGGAQRAQGAPGAPGAPTGAPAGGPGGPGGMRGGRGGDMQQMLERLPAIKLEDLKPGDAIIVSSTEGVDPGHVTAITLIAGVEPILSATPAGSQRAMMLGNWNMDMNMGGMQ